MTCDTIRPRLDDYLDRTLPPDAAREVEAHLATCASCRQEVEALRAILAEAQALPRSVERSRTRCVRGTRSGLEPHATLFLHLAHHLLLGLNGLALALHGRLLEMLPELHFAEDALALQLLLQGPEGLIDVIVANADLHVVSPPS